MSTVIDPKRVFVIIPAHNETKMIRSVVEDLLPHHYSIVVVDDGSSIDHSIFLRNLPVYFLRHCINLGQGAALQTGIEFALSKQAEYIVTFDADGQHQATDIPKLLQKFCNDDADVVLGSRFLTDSVHNMPKRREISLHLARFVNYFLTGLLLTDAHNGLRAMNKKAASTVQFQQNRMAHATEILIQIKKRNLRFVEVPVKIEYTPYSISKGQNIWSGFRIFFDILLHKIFE